MTDYAAAQERRAFAAKPDLATKDTVPLVLDCIQSAFWDDPVTSWFLRNDAKKSGALRMLTAGNLARSMKKDCAFVTGDGSAAAIWHPPAPPSPKQGLWQLAKRTPVLMQLTGLARLARMYRLIDVVGSAHPDEPEHYYLQFLGVRNEFQGQGLGSTLLATCLEKVDADTAPAYLESSNEKNVPLYERHGFRVVEELRLAKQGPVLWTMWREAQK